VGGAADDWRLLAPHRRTRGQHEQRDDEQHDGSCDRTGSTARHRWPSLEWSGGRLRTGCPPRRLSLPARAVALLRLARDRAPMLANVRAPPAGTTLARAPPPAPPPPSGRGEQAGWSPPLLRRGEGAGEGDLRRQAELAGLGRAGRGGDERLGQVAR